VRILSIADDTGGNVKKFTVPDGCIAIEGFAVVGDAFSAIGGARYDSRAALVAAAELTFSLLLSGSTEPSNLLGFAGPSFRTIPVSAGETYLVAFEATSTAVIYFTEAT